MLKRSAFWAFMVALALVSLIRVVLATPTPPYLLVNDTRQECAESILGDDCSWCDPPPGWEVVGLASSNQCPEGYRRVETIDLECRRYETPFCCSGGAHRGNCENMVIHDGEGACAFAEDVASCTLPDGWRARPPDVDPAQWWCPMDYRWVDAVECLGGKPEPDVSPGRGAASVSPGAGRPPHEQEPEASPRAGTVLAITGVIALAVYVVTRLILVFVASRQRRR